jgi:aryl-alcohol dehydrogenase-like predicted oxidoreductase
MPDQEFVIDAAGSFGMGPWRVRRVGYGAMQLAGDNVFGPPRDRDEALGVLRAAVDAGVNHIDTAQFYGAGVVNELIREALHPYPADLAIVSKIAGRGGGVALPSGGADAVLRGIEENLVALGAKRLAAVNLRMVDRAAPGRQFDEQLAVLVRAREEGMIDGIGLSNISHRHLLRALDQTEIVCVQNLFNLADQDSADVLAKCTRHGIAFVPFCPLGYPREVQNLIFHSPVVQSLAARLAATAAQIALAWLLDLAPNILLIPGTRTRTHLDDNLISASVVLDDQIRAELSEAFPADGPSRILTRRVGP